MAVEAAGLEAVEFRVERAYDALHGVDVLVDQRVGADELTDLLDAAAVRDQLFLGRHVDAVDVGVTHRRRRRGHVDPARAGLARHLHDLLAGGAAHDRVVDQQHVAALEFHADGVELLAHALLAHALPRHDESAADVAVLHEPFAVGLADAVRQLHRAGPAAFGDRDHDVDVARRHRRDQALRQRLAQVQPRLVDRDAVEHRVGPRQVDVLEHAGVELRLQRALARVDAAFEVDEDRLAGRHVARQAVAGAFQRHRFAGHHGGAALGLVRRRPLAETQRADAVGVAKSQQPVAGDECDHRIRTLDAPVHGSHRLEDLHRRQRQVACGELQFVRQHVDQHLGVAVGVDVAAVDLHQLGLQHRRVGEVAVVHEHDAEGRVDVEGLRLLFAVGVAGGRVAHLAQADAAGQRAHVAGAEDVAHHAARLVHEAARALHRDDARGVLPAVLQQQQRVVDQLVDGRLGDDADDAAHGGWFPMVCRVRTSTGAPPARATGA